MSRDDKVQKLHSAGHSALPEVRIPLKAFAEYLDDTPTAELDELKGADLYLACACLRGERAALVVLEQKLAKAVKGTGRIDPSPDFQDEVRQRLRVELVMKRGSRPPKLYEYSGHGKLDAWLGAIALGVAVTAQRERTRGRVRPGTPLPQVKILATDPEILLFRAQHGAQLRAAFTRALASLEPDHRELLRRYYLDGVQPEELAQEEGVHRTTVSRRLGQAQALLLKLIRKTLAERLGMSNEELQHSFGTVLDHLDLSLPLLLRP